MAACLLPSPNGVHRIILGPTYYLLLESGLSAHLPLGPLRFDSFFCGNTPQASPGQHSGTTLFSDKFHNCLMPMGGLGRSRLGSHKIPESLDERLRSLPFSSVRDEGMTSVW